MLLDGGIGFGQTLGLRAMDAGIPKAQKHGVAVVSMRNSHHLGRIGAWAERCADAGLVSVARLKSNGAVRTLARRGRALRERVGRGDRLEHGRQGRCGVGRG